MISEDQFVEWYIKLYHKDHTDWWVNRRLKLRHSAGMPDDYAQLLTTDHHYVHKLNNIWNQRKYGAHSNWVIQSFHSNRLVGDSQREVPPDGISIEDREIRWTADVDQPAFYSGPVDQSISRVAGTTLFHKIGDSSPKPIIRRWEIIGNSERLKQSQLDDLIWEALKSGWPYKQFGPISEYEIVEH